MRQEYEDPEGALPNLPKPQTYHTLCVVALNASPPPREPQNQDQTETFVEKRVCHQYVHSSTTQYTESLLHGYGLFPGVKPSLYRLEDRPVALARSVLAASPGLIPRCWNARHPNRTAAASSVKTCVCVHKRKAAYRTT